MTINIQVELSETDIDDIIGLILQTSNWDQEYKLSVIDKLRNK